MQGTPPYDRDHSGDRSKLWASSYLGKSGAWSSVKGCIPEREDGAIGRGEPVAVRPLTSDSDHRSVEGFSSLGSIEWGVAEGKDPAVRSSDPITAPGRGAVDADGRLRLAHCASEEGPLACRKAEYSPVPGHHQVGIVTGDPGDAHDRSIEVLPS